MEQLEKQLEIQSSIIEASKVSSYFVSLSRRVHYHSCTVGLVYYFSSTCISKKTIHDRVAFRKRC